MIKLKIFFLVLLTAFSSVLPGQVKVRVFSDQTPESVIFSATSGEYIIDFFNGETLTVTAGNPIIITKYNTKLAVKTNDAKGFVCDSVIIKGKTGLEHFSLRLNGITPLRRNYSGDLKCFPDLGTLLLINICDIEDYVAGVVKSEGGGGKYLEYFKTQAVIARTYMYKYFNKHLPDRYNVCDNTHCQAFYGLSADHMINKATLETEGQVILGGDTTLIIAAFHSNCGGQTAPSEDVWLSGLPYLVRVADPYCMSSRNAKWEKSISRKDWLAYMRKSGLSETNSDPSSLNFVQISRQTDYRSGSFSLPLRTIRTDMNLKSTFFSVVADNEKVTFKGRGYGHGVGLCQEGAMVMASRGFDYRKIIDFYYSGVVISDVKNALLVPPDTLYGAKIDNLTDEN